ncbi:MAG: carbonic anhydrase [Planctomycetota bacterium]|jgi:carbonic anhydrase
MRKLVEGVRQFQEAFTGATRSLYEGLAGGQHPLAMFIGCSDSRVSPSLLTQAEAGDLFVLRNAGNIVPHYGSIDGGEAATIEYAVGVLGVRHIIICGHSHCGAMAGLLNPESLQSLPAVKSWLGHADATHEIIKDKFGHIVDQDERLTVTVEQNVLVQLENLRSHPTVAAALERDELTLHGWVYRFETCEVFQYDFDEKRFEALAGS